ncbi:MAG TPA: hypothetical protein VD978_30695 [Azospirillum sp.]|nr:hypothetical protein [Azospirillum sp.]
MHQTQRFDPIPGGLEFPPGILRPGVLRLDRDEAGDDLKVVLHPVLQFPKKTLLPVDGRLQFGEQIQPLDRGSEEIRIAAEEVDVGLGKCTRCAAVDLEDAIRWLLSRAEDGDVAEGPDAVFPDEIRDRKVVLALDIQANGRFAGIDRLCFQGAWLLRNREMAGDAALPARARAHQQGAALRLQFHNFGEVGAEARTDEASGFLKYGPETVGLESKAAELQQHRPLDVEFFPCCLGSVAHGPTRHAGGLSPDE